MIRTKRSKLEVGWIGQVDHRWMRLLDHFPSVELLELQTASEWLVSPSPERVLLIGLEHRNDPKLAWLLDLENRFRASAAAGVGLGANLKKTPAKKAPVKKSSLKKTAPKKANTTKVQAQSPTSLGPLDWSKQVSMACVLGEDWAGHRRTFPLPDSIESFYWHQWYDRVLPWVLWRAQRIEYPGIALRTARILHDADQFGLWRPLEQTQTNLGNKVAWVLSDQSFGSQMWYDAFEAYGVRAIGSGLGPTHCEFAADLVLVDQTARTGQEFSGNQIAESLRSIVARVRTAQPDAFLVVVDSFTQMDLWDALKQLGVDAIVDRPFSLPGLLCTWESWLSSEDR